ncbi:hypothetical protein EON83_20260 [bacterium]|nr:MAG: hypothetical protein EON83_20260 [bacterium]
MTSFGSFAWFPLTFETAGSTRSFDTRHTQNDNADSFDALQQNGLWRFNLSGMKILASNIDEWDAFHDYVKGQWLPFLFRLNSRRFEILRDQPGGVGTGNGTQKQFQLIKTRALKNGPTSVTSERVRYPVHGYPEMRIPLGNSDKGPILYPENERVRIWLGDIEQTTGWDVDRETGIVTFAVAPPAGVIVRAACRFAVLVHGQDQFFLQNQGGVYIFSDGAALFQVASEA